MFLGNNLHMRYHILLHFRKECWLWKWGCDPLTGQPATLFKSFEALCNSWIEFLCSQVLDITLSKSQVLLRARGSSCLLGKPLIWNCFISLIWHSFPLQFWMYHLIAKSLNFLICMLSRDNSASLHSRISRWRWTQFAWQNKDLVVSEGLNLCIPSALVSCPVCAEAFRRIFRS